uniref:Galactose mutarotase n=1 Tax=Acrobeloides nanus TaxID=290746 RepID=A0A914DBJ6_9BILA
MLKLLVLFLFVNLITAQSINKEPFGTLPTGQNVSIYTLENNNGVAIKATDYGATLVSVKVPTGNGQEEILLGFDNLGDYLNHTAYFGGTIGRFANRIANSTFTYNNTVYNLSKNDPDPIKGPNSLHGGRRGFDKLLWNVTLSSINTLKFELLSPDGDEGYPGNLNVTVLLSLSDDDEIIWTYEATTDKTTPINLSNHGYWNLAGAGSGRNGIDGQTIQIPANYYVPVDPKYLIPTGEIKNVTGTPYDLTASINIGEAINKTDISFLITMRYLIALTFCLILSSSFAQLGGGGTGVGLHDNLGANVGGTGLNANVGANTGGGLLRRRRAPGVLKGAAIGAIAGGAMGAIGR